MWVLEEERVVLVPRAVGGPAAADASLSCCFPTGSTEARVGERQRVACAASPAGLPPA